MQRCHRKCVCSTKNEHFVVANVHFAAQTVRDTMLSLLFFASWQRPLTVHNQGVFFTLKKVFTWPYLRCRDGGALHIFLSLQLSNCGSDRKTWISVCVCVLGREERRRGGGLKGGEEGVGVGGGGGGVGALLTVINNTPHVCDLLSFPPPPHETTPSFLPWLGRPVCMCLHHLSAFLSAYTV